MAATRLGTPRIIACMLCLLSLPLQGTVAADPPALGELAITINKHDVDLGVTVYEQTPDGKLFHLGYSPGRASYANDREKRTLLTPGTPTRSDKSIADAGEPLKIHGHNDSFVDVPLDR